MRTLAVYGGLGLLLGLTLQKSGFTEPRRMRRSVLLRGFTHARTWLYTLGLGIILTALLCWLAVIDVDRVDVLPLHSGVLIGGVFTGAALGLGVLPVALLGGAGGGRWLQSLCGLAGCCAGWLLCEVLPLQSLRTLMPEVNGTLFHLTLDDPWLLDGGFLGLSCLGALLCVLALFIRSKHKAESEPDADADELVLLDELEDFPEEAGVTDAMEDASGEALSADVRAVLAQSAVASSEPVPVDDQLPEVEPETASDEASLIHEAVDMPSPMEDEALQDLGAIETHHEP